VGVKMKLKNERKMVEERETKRRRQRRGCGQMKNRVKHEDRH